MRETSGATSSEGKIITFYSYKGGTGRTMALANIAWILAANGHRVLAADWDLESPGLHRFLHPFLPTAERDTRGVVDMIRSYQMTAVDSDESSRRNRHIGDHARVEQYAFSLDWIFPGGGTLDFIPAGRQNLEYVATLATMDWDEFYSGLNGGEFLDAVRADMKRQYDYVLIDSRTGLTDVADICTVHLPDILVDCFTLSTQGIEGAARVARLIESQYPDRKIRILPVPMRVDQAEKERVEAGRAFAGRLFAGLPTGMTEVERQQYWGAVEVPYQPFYAFEEILAVFGDRPGMPGSLLSSFERLAAQLTGGSVTSLPVLEEDLRVRVRQRFVRRPVIEGNEIQIRYYPEDQSWAEWLTALFGESGFTVREFRLGDSVTEEVAESASGLSGNDQESGATPMLSVISAAYLARHGKPGTARGISDAGDSDHARPGYAAYVTATPPLPEFPTASSVSLVDASEFDAARRLGVLLGMADAPRLPTMAGVPAPRFPGAEPKLVKANARNPRFTGREEDIRELRKQLRTAGTTVVVAPVALQGLGGVGKTQVALEYLHRFKSDYDLIWWVECGQAQFIDAQLADLADQLTGAFAIASSADVTLEEKARSVLTLLARPRGARPVEDWLLIYDNAEDIEAVTPWLPRGGGHTLITSRNGAWAELARPIEVEVFTRPESIAHLRRVDPGITATEADQVAEALGDLPLAIEAAAVWLKDTDYRVADYLRELESHAPEALELVQLPGGYPRGVAAAWDPSLNLLRERSPAAMRLLQLCSVMAPNIARDLIYSQGMATVLKPYDASLSEPMVIGRVVREAGRLALLKIDSAAGQIQVHRLVQAVVRGRMTDDELAATRRDVQHILVAARPGREVDDPETWSLYRIIWPHLGPSQAMASDEEEVRQLSVDRVRFLWVGSDLDRAAEVADTVTQRWAELAATAEPVTAKVIRKQLLQLEFNLANVRRSQSRFTEAAALNKLVLDAQTELLGADHPHTLTTASSYAADLRALGRYREALAMDEQTSPAWAELYGEDHRRAIDAAHNLAISYRLTGNVADSLRLDITTQDRYRATIGARHPNALRSAGNIARDLIEAGGYAEAVTRAQGVHRLCSESLGARSPVTLDAQVLLGIALRSMGRYEEAEKEFTAAQQPLDDRFGKSSSQGLACRLSHAANLLQLDQLASAAQDIGDVLAAYAQRLGEQHPHTLTCRVNLASVLRLQHQYDEAMAEVEVAVSGLTEALGLEHPYTLAAAMVRATLIADRGNFRQSAELDEGTAASLAAVLGPRHPDTLRCRGNMLLTRQLLGEEKAAGEREALLAQLSAVIGAGHPTVDVLRAGRRPVRVLDPQPF
jgi:tetratricopeptide (TPR) repeat protein/CO dehydrogenase nickel-insertion accessory protein CooC1